MDFQSFGTDSALYTIMRNEKLSSTGIARLGLRDTERTATTGKKMDHFDAEITCEEFYSDEERHAWEQRLEAEDTDHDGQFDYC